MKTTKLILITFTLLAIIEGCKSKKNTTATATTTSTAKTDSVKTTTGFSIFSNPTTSKDGVYAPGENELVAIQKQFSDVTLEKLKIGHMLYTVGPCVNCHGAKNIYKRETSRWKSIITEMAEMAKLNTEQTDAVYKYVLSIKATQAK
ncbi:MAG: hypothetical protein JNJ40_08940 [Bacteroidia bacterium]|nr:hypothetical protein [Bacteroidia bacterium]